MASIRVSHNVVEVAIQLDPSVRVTHDVVEAAVDQDPAVRFTQTVVEAAIRDPFPRITQEPLEVVLNVPDGRVTQLPLEVALNVPDARVTQVAVEVLLSETQDVSLPTISSGSQLFPPTVESAAAIQSRITQDVRVVPLEPDTTARVTEDIRVIPTTGDASGRLTEEVRVVPTTGDTSPRVTHIIREVITDGDSAARITQDVRLVVITRANETEFLPEFLGTFGPLLWLEFEDPTDDEIHVFSQVDLNDPETYYFGFKLGSILTADRVTRALSSDDDGTIEGQQFALTFADVERYWRQLIGRDDLQRIIINRHVRMRMISNVGRLAQEIPRTVALGLIRGYETS